MASYLNCSQTIKNSSDKFCDAYLPTKFPKDQINFTDLIIIACYRVVLTLYYFALGQLIAASQPPRNEHSTTLGNL